LISDAAFDAVGYHRLAEYPIYISAGLETRAIRSRWLSTMSQHLIFGAPATALLFFLLALALRRTQTLYFDVVSGLWSSIAPRATWRRSARLPIATGLPVSYLTYQCPATERLTRSVTNPGNGVDEGR